MNWSTAICAVASCMATRSAHHRPLVQPASYIKKDPFPTTVTRNSVTWAKPQVAYTPLDFLMFWIVNVPIHILQSQANIQLDGLVKQCCVSSPPACTIAQYTQQDF